MKKISQSLLLKRNYLIWIAREELKMQPGEIGKIFGVSRPSVYAAIKSNPQV